ncbi:non-ribosomal peptide synthetase, partial [Lentzea aerocolonigenes]|uniref:non-ribosomal peptide synthetase n=1 Tax=Lentzea aerocolonigenes TaxID=68170 RepID=UPI0005ED21CC
VAVRRDADLLHWREVLNGAPLLQLPTDRPRPAVRSGDGASVTREFGADLAERLRVFAGTRRGTVFTTVLGALGAVLSRFSGQDDFTVGTAVSNRPPDARDVVGMFLDTVPLRLDLAGDPSFAELTHRIRDLSTEALDHRDVQFDELVAAVNPERDLGRNPLFDVMVEFERQDDIEFAPPELTATLRDVPSDRAPFDLTYYFTQHRDGLRCVVEYDTALFDEATVSRLLDYVGHVLDRALTAPDAPLSELVTLTRADRALLTADSGEQAGRPEACLHELVEQQALRTPDTVALMGRHGGTTYRELVERAAGLAAALRDRGAGPGAVVGVLLPRGAYLIVAVLAVLRSGAAYLPLDPELPAARLRYLAGDSAAALVITSRSTVDKAVDLPVQYVEDAVPAPHEPVPGDPDGPAYVIYTSGSTGRPKGVVVPHRGPVNLVRWHLRHHEPLRTAQWTSLSFDVSVQEIFTTLAAGATLVLVDAGERHDLADLVVRYGVQRLFLPFSPLRHLLDQRPSLSSLREVFSAGEAMVITPSVRWFLSGHPLCALYNQYGPTETSIIVTSHRVDPVLGSRPPIGRPITGARVEVVDAAGRAVPVGAVGEIRVSGLPVATGYVGLPPFGDDYRTGDLGRVRPDGEIEFLGRRDDQVKIRGHRVEPGEVTAALSEVDGVAAAAVIARPDRDGAAELVAYVVPAHDAVDVTQLRDRLAETLPGHLVPRSWVTLDRLPHQVNGKLDRTALPEPAPPAPTACDEMPVTDAELSVHEIWCAELGLPRIGVTRSFFAAGGHSLNAVKVVHRIAVAHDTRMTVAEFFAAPTIRAVAARLETTATSPVTSVVSRLWHKQQRLVEPSVHHIAHRVDVEGDLDVPVLRRALAELVRRHEALRTRFLCRDGELVAEVLPAFPVDLVPERVTDAGAWCSDWVAAPFALDRSPLFRIGLAETGPGRHVLVTVFHHAICDAWSLTVLWRDLAELYAGRDLPRQVAQYADRARWEREVLGGGDRARLELFWRTELRGASLTASLPADRLRPARLSGRGGLHRAEAGLGAVRAAASGLGVTPNAVLVAGLGVWLSLRTGRTDVVVPLSSANRVEPGHEDVVGLLGDVLPLRLRLSEVDDFAGLVVAASSALARSLDHAALPLTEIVRAVGAKEPPDLLCTVVTTPPARVSLPGLRTTTRPVLRPGAARTELYVVLVPGEETVEVLVEYSADLFDEGTVAAWTAELVDVLTWFANDPHQPLSSLANSGKLG